MRGIVVTIDGPAGAGKSSTARAVAERLAYRYLDTGALYRALALAVIRAGLEGEPGPEAVAVCVGADVRPLWRGSRMAVLLDGTDVSAAIRDPAVTRLVSPLSAIPEVRRLLVGLQREAAREGRIVVEGRDIGSVVLPEAPLKIFLVADLDERARRRVREREAAGEAVSFEAIRRAIEERDRRDASREVAPLVRPEGAVEIDTTGLTLAEQADRIVRLAREREG